MSVKLMTEQHLEFLCLKGGCTGSSESTHVKMPHCWKSHALAHFSIQGLQIDTFFPSAKKAIEKPQRFKGSLLNI